jgi:DNA-binding transcriptional LysR family regulator
MNIRFLETFVWLARLKNFSRTGEALNMTQPAISSRVSTLEQLLGVELYNKHSKEFELTEQGRELLRYAERILDLYGELKQAVNRPARDLSTFRLGIIELGMASWLRAFLAAFLVEFPAVVVHIRTGTTGTLIRELRENAIDIAFVVGPVNEHDIHNDQICSLAFDWYANPDFFPCDVEIDVVELSRMSIIPYSTESSATNTLNQYFKTYGVAELPTWQQRIVIDGVYSAWSGAHAVREGLGVMALPTFLFEADIQAGHFTRLPVRQKIPALNITACYESVRHNAVITTAVTIARQSAAEYAKLQDANNFWI